MFSEVQEKSESFVTHRAPKRGVIGVPHGLHAGGARGGDVVFAVVDEEDLCAIRCEAFGRVPVDRGIGLCYSETM
jgi:hypothetical protein